MQVDETYCGPLCQHPSCWDSHKRCSRGIPYKRYDTSDSDSDYDESGDYGPDTRDLYPAEHSGRPAHERTNTSIQMGRSGTRDSFPKVRAPNATPASFLRSSANNGSHSAPVKTSGKGLSQVEVQEVFDLDDLQSAWNDTFKTKSYYVWVPNSKARKPKLEPLQSVKYAKRRDGPHSVLPKDKTEDMMPRGIGLEKQPTKLRKLQLRSPRMDTARPYPKTPQQDKKRDHYYGIYELLDLPREVLVGVLDHIQERDLLDRQKFAEALVRAIPKLEKRSKSLALANSQVLKQRKIKLIDGASKTGQLPSNTKQVFMLDGETLEKVSSANDPSSLMKETPADDDEFVETGQAYTPHLLDKKPLPSIARDSPRTKIPSISLGLPVIPSGTKATQPFNYKNKSFDFTLGRVPTPPETKRSESPSSTERGSTLHVTMPSMPSEDAASGVKGWQREESFHEPSQMPLHAVSPAHSTQVPIAPAATPATRQGEGGFSTPYSAGGSPQKPLSRDQQRHSSPHTPKLPVPVPAQINKEATAPELGSPEQTALGTIPEADIEQQSLGTRAQTQPPPHSRRSVRFAEVPVPPTPPQPPSSPTASSRPTSPAREEEDLTREGEEEEEEKPDPTMDGLMIINKMKGTHRQPSSLSGGVGGTKQSSLPPSSGNLLSAMPAVDGNTMSPGLSPEPEPDWPEVDETKYMRTPTPPTRDVTKLSLADPLQSTMANYDSKSGPPSGVTSMAKGQGGLSRESTMPRVVTHLQPDEQNYQPQINREVTMQSDKTKLVMSDRVMESPGPPPPSPEPKDMESTGPGLTDDANKSVSVELGTITSLERADDPDDETPRPQNPANTPEVTPRPEGPANTPIPTEATASVGGTPRPMNIVADIPEEGASPLNDTPREDPLNILPPGTQPPTPYESSVGTTVLGVQQSGSPGEGREGTDSVLGMQQTGSPGEGREGTDSVLGVQQAGSPEDGTDTQPLAPLGASHVTTDPRIQLDQFDASPAELQQELKDEYDKLSEDK